MAKDPNFKKMEAEKGIAAYQAEQAKVHNNMLRLKAERLAREAAAAAEPVPEPKAKPSKARKKAVSTGS